MAKYVDLYVQGYREGVKAAIRRGHWEEMRDAYGDLEGWMCGECGTSVKCASNFCPNCGAKMYDEVKDEQID